MSSGQTGNYLNWNCNFFLLYKGSCFKPFGPFSFYADVLMYALIHLAIGFTNIFIKKIHYHSKVEVKMFLKHVHQVSYTQSLHLFDQKYCKNSNIVKYYNAQLLFWVLIYFKKSFLLVMTKLTAAINPVFSGFAAPKTFLIIMCIILQYIIQSLHIHTYIYWNNT